MYWSPYPVMGSHPLLHTHGCGSMSLMRTTYSKLCGIPSHGNCAALIWLKRARWLWIAGKDVRWKKSNPQHYTKCADRKCFRVLSSTLGEALWSEPPLSVGFSEFRLSSSASHEFLYICIQVRAPHTLAFAAALYRLCTMRCRGRLSFIFCSIYWFT